MRKLIEVEVVRGGVVVYRGGWDSLIELQRESLPRLFGEHLAKKLEAKE